jgi:hypothetical protein
LHAISISQMSDYVSEHGSSLLGNGISVTTVLAPPDAYPPMFTTFTTVALLDHHLLLFLLSIAHWQRTQRGAGSSPPVRAHELERQAQKPHETHQTRTNGTWALKEAPLLR